MAPKVAPVTIGTCGDTWPSLAAGHLVHLLIPCGRFCTVQAQCQLPERVASNKHKDTKGNAEHHSRSELSNDEDRTEEDDVDGNEFAGIHHRTWSQFSGIGFRILPRKDESLTRNSPSTLQTLIGEAESIYLESHG